MLRFTLLLILDTTSSKGQNINQFFSSISLIFLLSTTLAFYSLISTSKGQLPSKQRQYQDPLNGTSTITTPNMQGSDSHPHTDYNDAQRDWEMTNVSKVPQPSSIYTPRTLAFHTLDRRFPLATY